MNQTHSLKEQLKSLVQLQEIDLKIDLLTRKKESLPNQLSETNLKISGLEKKLQTKENELNALEKVKRQAVAAVELNQERITRTTSKVENVQNTKEFQAATKEVEQLKKLNEELATQQKDADEKITALQKEAGEIKEELDKIKSERDAKMNEVGSEATKIESELKEIMASRSSVEPEVDKANLLQYQRIREARAGLGIVPVDSGRCTGCNMMIPPQLHNQLFRMEEVFQCPSCHRIMYLPDHASSQN